MTKRTLHVGKSSQEKTSYIKQLQNLNYEPTVEPKPIFYESDDSVEEIPGQISAESRPQTIRDSISGIKKYWAQVLIAILVMFVGLFLYNISRDIGSLQGSLIEIKNIIQNFQDKLQKIEDKVQGQGLEIREQKVRIDYLEKERENRTEK